MFVLLSASSSSELLIVDWIVNSLNPFIEEIRLSLVTLAIYPRDGKMVEWTLVTFAISPCDGEMVVWTLFMFGIYPCDGEMVQCILVTFAISPCHGDMVQWLNGEIVSIVT